MRDNLTPGASGLELFNFSAGTVNILELCKCDHGTGLESRLAFGLVVSFQIAVTLGVPQIERRGHYFSDRRLLKKTRLEQIIFRQRTSTGYLLRKIICLLCWSSNMWKELRPIHSVVGPDREATDTNERFCDQEQSCKNVRYRR